MSGQSSGDKTEPPTPKRLRDARKKGQVAKSKEVVSAAIIVSILAYLIGASDYFMSKFEQLINLPLWIEQVSFRKAFDPIVEDVVTLGLMMVLPVALLALLVAFLANFIQVGVLFAPEAVKPDIKKLNPAKKIKEIFSRKNSIELIKSILKIAIMIYLVYHVVWNGASELMRIPYCGIDCLMTMLGSLFKQLVIYASVAFVVVAIADYVFQKVEFIKGLKMSKDEIKREYKEMEGSPEIKGQRKSMFMEIVNSQQRSTVKNSNVIVTNPTHLAIGLYYDPDKIPLPVVILKEQGLSAQNVVNIAQQEGIPIMQNIPLAHSLMSDVQLHGYIPDSLFTPVAEVLRAVQEVSKQ
ncbi:MAG: type III secretion system export apparatus subunit SctU [Candidatus Oxydemutatoraceae bacterium WSBS_2016_MAG_OTU14]